VSIPTSERRCKITIYGWSAGFTHDERERLLTAHPAEAAIRAIWEMRRSYSEVPSPRLIGSPYALVGEVISEKLAAAGIAPSCIQLNKALSLPGSYGLDRPWDLVVVVDNIPVAAIEIAVQAGPSFLNNLRNRMSELLGMATDVDRQYEVDELRPHKPSLGIVFILEETGQSTKPLRSRQGLMGESAEGDTGASVQDRYAKFFERLLADQKYEAICYLAATPLPDLKVSEPCDSMGFDHFVETVAQRATTIASLNGKLDLTSVKFGELLAQRDDLGRVMSGITSTSVGLSAAEHAVIERRRQLVRELIAMAMEEDVNETRMQGGLCKTPVIASSRIDARNIQEPGDTPH
jgi:hypothetical protein